MHQKLLPIPFCAVLVTFIAPAATSTVVPQAGPPTTGNECECVADSQEQNWNCADEAYARVTIEALAHGTCSSLWDLCLDADPCRWKFTIEYKSTNPNAHLRVWRNPGTTPESNQPLCRALGYLEIGPLYQTLDCDQGCVVTLTSGDNVYAEAMFACLPCPASND